MKAAAAHFAVRRVPPNRCWEMEQCEIIVANYCIFRRKSTKGLLNLKWLRLQFGKKTVEKI
jgi:hypothetical protein